MQGYASIDYIFDAIGTYQEIGLWSFGAFKHRTLVTAPHGLDLDHVLKLFFVQAVSDHGGPGLELVLRVQFELHRSFEPNGSWIANYSNETGWCYYNNLYYFIILKYY